MTAAGGATDHVDKLIDKGWNLVMFPEGTRSRDGEIGKLRSGAAVIAAQHGIPIVPIHVRGTHDAMPPGQNWPKRKPGRFFSRRHQLEVRFGQPIRPESEEARREVMEEAGIEVGEVSYFGNQPWPFPSSLMVGFFGRALTTDIHVDDDELEAARWFTREDVRRGGESGDLVTPGGFSISRSLVEAWYGEALPGTW